ncbi:hypothetical protein [Peribacillus asahii]|uniref:hypothetical protein n=1 Tax=Peribacillus asahii TaxID=228899 RepID=UPI00207968BA|nr:hypothetical protein [Peribacillus asahii]USK68976.1 hypothetical protein LIS76_15565 [Peribacillus asahii]
MTEETKAIQEETDAVIRKEKRRALSPFKKLLRVVNEDFRPRLVKYQQQNVLFGDRNSYSKQIQMRHLCE